MQSTTTSTQTYDLVILGAGSGGYAAALRAAQLGQRVALIEQGKLGGTCLHEGCIPTKALLHTAEVADQVKDSAHVGVHASLDSIDASAMRAYKDSIVKRLFTGLQGLVKSANIDFVTGRGRLLDRNTVVVDGHEIRGENVILATGSYAKSLPGLDFSGRVLSSTEAMNLEEVPGSVIVLGGGVIGVEFASIWASLGSDVTIVEAADRLVPTEEAVVSKTLARAFRKRKITARTGVSVDSVSQDEHHVSVSLADGTSLQADYLLVAIGRGPRTSDLGYEEAGVAMERGFITTDASLRTSVPGVYAVGDIVPGPQLAHRGFAQGIFVAEHIAGLEPVPVDDVGIPRVTYCNPEIASVGLTEEQAQERYGDVSSYEYNLGGNGKSQILGTAGLVKLIRQADGPIVGIHMIGARVGEQVGEAQLIYNWEALPEDVAGLIHAHPTQNEALGEAHLALAGKPLHAHS
ncbi:dihydrolipoyl dehydrogenase [Ornithinimicrobium sp. Arc0846-15]|nr:dihydrolipoyl dehydrogenase [Ornithinimicrobium laminariae]